MRLSTRIGKGCKRLLEEKMQNLECKEIQVDEIWTYVGKKQKTLNKQEKHHNIKFGDQYVFVAIDANTKLIPSFVVGKRNADTAYSFMHKLMTCLNKTIPQLTTDGYTPYKDAVEFTFGCDINFAQLIKVFERSIYDDYKYSPPRVIRTTKEKVCERPDFDKISTSYIERQNLTMRMQMRRFTRLTNAFSKKLENLVSALYLHFAHYNFVRIHKTLQVTPAMEAGITDRIWDIEDILGYGC
jgi:IS1 family transposase